MALRPKLSHRIAARVNPWLWKLGWSIWFVATIDGAELQANGSVTTQPEDIYMRLGRYPHRGRGAEFRGRPPHHFVP